MSGALSRSSFLIGCTTARPSAGEFAVIRSGLALGMGLRIGTMNAHRLSVLEGTVFRPPGVLSMLNGVPPTPVMGLLELVGVVLAVCVLLNRRPRLCFRLLLVDFVLVSGFATSFGKVLHNEVLIILASFPIAMATVGTVSRRSSSTGFEFAWPLSLARVVVVLAYFMAGMQKVVHSGLAWATSDNMHWILYQAAAGGRPPFVWLTTAVGSVDWLTRMSSIGALGLELTMPMCLLFPKLRNPFALGAVLMHCSIWLLLGLDYWRWIVVDVLVVSTAASALAHRMRPAGVGRA